MKTCFACLFLTGLCLCFPAVLPAQELAPSVVIHQGRAGQYRRVNYEPQAATHNGIDYRQCYLIDGTTYYLKAQSTVILGADGSEIYAEGNNNDGYDAYPTFYYPKNKKRPTVVVVSRGMENYWGSEVYVGLPDGSFTRAGYLDLAPRTGDWAVGEYDRIETILRLKNRGRDNVRITFAGDSLIYGPSGHDILIPARGVYFTLNGDQLSPSRRLFLQMDAVKTAIND